MQSSQVRSAEFHILFLWMLQDQQRNAIVDGRDIGAHAQGWRLAAAGAEIESHSPICA
jgi:hypothetical protein